MGSERQPLPLELASSTGAVLMMLNSDTDGTYQVQLPEFEGPLDLLLHLVKRHELNICDIPIAFITEKYLSYLDVMRSLNIDIAGGYLLMASTLAYLKSRELLPQLAEDDEGEEEGEEGDPRESLIRRLLEYQRYKDAAEQLGNRPALGKGVFTLGSPPEQVQREDAPLAEVGTFALMAALQDVLQRSRVELTYDVLVERISISDRINEIVDGLQRESTIRLLDFLDLDAAPAQLRHQFVVTFLAVLEMAKLNMVRMLQQEPTSEIYLTRTTHLHAVHDADTDPLEAPVES